MRHPASCQTLVMKPLDRSERLRRFLQAYWLRPENALWMALRSEVLAPYPLEPPCLDFCCGDGVFTFLHQRGVFEPSFDVFTAVDRLDGVLQQHVDIFDCPAEDYDPPIVSPPLATIQVGCDHKATLLNKAKRLGLYERLIEHNGNKPFPFEDDSFQTVYCNAAYWMVHIDGFLAELRRVTRPGGRVVLQVKLDRMRRYTLEAHRSALGDRVLDIIGRGRLETWPSLADQATWESRFQKAELSVEAVTPFITPTHAHLWDIGLRPIAPMLIRMAQSLTPETRRDIKAQWVDLFRELLEPLCDPAFDLFSGSHEPAEIQYVLQPG